MPAVPFSHTETFGFVAAGHRTAVIVAEHNHRPAFERRVDCAFAAYEEIIAIGKTNHFVAALVQGMISVTLASVQYVCPVLKTGETLVAELRERQRAISCPLASSPCSMILKSAPRGLLRRNSTVRSINMASSWFRFIIPLIPRFCLSLLRSRHVAASRIRIPSSRRNMPSIRFSRHFPALKSVVDH